VVCRSVFSEFIGNSAAQKGGALYVGGEHSYVELNNNGVIGNTAADVGGGVHLNGVSQLFVDGSLFADNTASQGCAGCA
jgi:predicted outer membrane repeat protein